MTFTSKEKKRLANLINSFGNTSLKDGEIEINYDQKPYYNLISALYEIDEIQEIYDEDIAIYGIGKEIVKRTKTLPVKIKEEEVEEILKNVVKTLKVNITDHLIVIPLQFAQFKNKIRIDNLTFIPPDFSARDKMKIIARLAKKTLDETIWIVEHTEKSRSPDFLKYPLLCVKQTQQTHSVHFNSLNITKIIINAIRCFYFGNIKKTSKDKTTILVSYETQSHKIASHLAIYSKENWRQNHKPLNFDVSVPFDLSWLEDRKISKRFSTFIKRIYFKGKLDNLNLCFLNSLILFNDSIRQNTSISTIITMTIAESILTRNKNEKRLRISAIIPRLMNFPKNQHKAIAKTFNELYQKRNNFVHSGEEVKINYNFETSEPTILELGRKIIAQLILEYPNFEKMIEKKSTNEELANSKKARMNFWERYVDSIFQEIIYGK